jgi:hypothetical protein
MVPKRSVLVRFKEGEKEPVRTTPAPTNRNIDTNNLSELVENIEVGQLSNSNAEARANIGKEREPGFLEAQSFDGPLPETINGRAAMIGVVSGLGAELTRGIGLVDQIKGAPTTVLLTFALLIAASAIPVFRGYTRKEPYANTIWQPQAENYNGRAAMLGFACMVLLEGLTHQTTTEFWSKVFGGLY